MDKKIIEILLEHLFKYCADFELTGVVPKHPTEKKPTGLGKWEGKWSKIPHMTLAETKALFNCNHGGVLLILGMNNLVMIDLDCKNDRNGVADLEELVGESLAESNLLKTLTTTTPSGGRHFIFKRTTYFDACWEREVKGRKSIQSVGRTKGIDILLENPTPLPPTKGYEFINDCAPEAISNELTDRVISLLISTHGDLIIHGVSAGNRNNQLNKMLFLHKKENPNIIFDDLLIKALEINEEHMLPPLPYDEVKQIAISVGETDLISDKSLVAIKKDGNQLVVAEYFKENVLDTILYTPSFGFCTYDNRDGVWKTDQEIYVKSFLLTVYVKGLINRKKAQLDLEYGHQLKRIDEQLEQFGIAEPFRGVENTITEGEIPKAIKLTPEEKKTMEDVEYLRKNKIAMENQISKELKPFLKLGNYVELNGITNILKGQLMKEDKIFNHNPYLLNLKNGTYDFKDDIFRPHSLYDYIDYQCPFSYDKNAKAPVFDKFMNEITKGDRKTRVYILMLLSFCLTGLTEDVQKFFIFTGGGKNGKSVLTYIMQAILGEALFDTFNPETFVKSSGSGSNNFVFDLGSNKNKRLMTVSEFPEGVKLNTELIKRITGDDLIRGRLPRGNFFSYTPTYKLIMTGNRPIAIDASAKAMSRRIIVIPFLQTFSDDFDIEEMKAKEVKYNESDIVKADFKLRHKLKGELPGIFNTLVLHFQMYKQEAIKDNPFISLQSDIIKKATNEYLYDDRKLNRMITDKYKIFKNPTDFQALEWRKRGWAITLDDFRDDLNAELKSGDVDSKYHYKNKTIRQVLKDLEVRIMQIPIDSKITHMIIITTLASYRAMFPNGE